VLALFTAWTLVEIVTRWRTPSRRLWMLAGSAALLMLACNIAAFGVRDSPAFDLDYKIAYAYQQKGRDEEALRAYRESVRRNPNGAPARNALGYLLAQRGEALDEAARLIEEALQIDPARTANYAESLAFVELRRGDPDAALAACARGLAAARDARTRSLLQLRRAEALVGAGRDEEAKEELRALVEASPQGEAAAEARERLRQLERKAQTPADNP
jgi:tetratricopeptide (TPR) repeat protein